MLTQLTGEMTAMPHEGNSHPNPESGVADECANGNLFGSGIDGERARGIAVISHELRNSLAVIRNAARLLRTAASSDRIESTRTLIERHAGQMSRHIDDLLEPRHRGMRGDALLQLSQVDLRTIAAYAVESIRPEMARRGHRLVVNLPEEPVWALADGARLEQAFSNLLINASKYTPDGGDISLLMEASAESVNVRIRDSGIGIDPAMLSRVFGMFVQVANAPPGREIGRGIGLAVVRSIIELHGGTVTVTSAGRDLGSEFAVVLPSMSAQRRFVIIAP
jgi:two-component system CheB/CheR fusion protein